MIWRKEGPQAYPELAEAQRLQDEARAEQIRLMKETFPEGTRVLIRHNRGEYTGTVKRTDQYRVYVINDTSGKTSSAYPLLDTRGKLSVEIID
ncbi:TPA: hypothetical protein ACGJ1E_005259 [Pseudomonas aeruginosa]|uniref:hypothetical protein n=1 Tax=Pseudomonas aeruginosa TaxID=287 RepID=UPI00053DE090|nr:hypothetical protein [Pseudomonas aeruginosa]